MCRKIDRPRFGSAESKCQRLAATVKVTWLNLRHKTHDATVACTSRLMRVQPNVVFIEVVVAEVALTDQRAAEPCRLCSNLKMTALCASRTSSMPTSLISFASSIQSQGSSLSWFHWTKLVLGWFTSRQETKQQERYERFISARIVVQASPAQSYSFCTFAPIPMHIIAYPQLRVFGGEVDGMRVKAHHLHMLSQVRTSDFASDFAIVMA